MVQTRSVRSRSFAAKSAGILVALSVGVSGVFGGAPLAQAQADETLSAPGDRPSHSAPELAEEPSLVPDQSDGDVVVPPVEQGTESAVVPEDSVSEGPPIDLPSPITEPSEPPAPESSDPISSDTKADLKAELEDLPKPEFLTNAQRFAAVEAEPRAFVGAQYAGCTTFVDVGQRQKFYSEIEWMHRAKLTTGVKTSAGLKFLPKSKLTREAMAAFLFRKHGKAGWKPSSRSPFRDVAPGHKFYKEILWMHETGLTTGIRTGRGLEYQPKSTVSREAMAAFFYRQYAKSYQAPSKSRFVDVSRGHKFYREISWMRDAGISTGVAAWNGARAYEPRGQLTREALAAFMYRQAGSPKVSDNCLKKWADTTFGTFKKKTISGYGTEVVSLPASAGIMKATHEGSSNFIVWTLTKQNRQNDLLVNEIGRYSGTVPFGVNERETHRKIQVAADGYWELVFEPLGAASAFKGSGNGDSVMLYGGSAATLSLTHRGRSNFIVIASGSGYGNWNLIANEIGNYNGNVAVPAGPLVYVITADGKWTAQVR